ncbi:MAG: hypothetical protein IJC71_04570 [Clostridia bacterium]|nr:hypothetical protein [Clostridia bacterium]
MAHCCNCGIEIPSEDKIRLCDRCKKIILPFVKFMDASTSSAVRRLVSNERNLRNAGVTDGGMDYLFRICELHDKQKMREKQEREQAGAVQTVQTSEEEQPLPQDNGYFEEELPMDKPLQLRRKPYGGFLPAAEILLLIVGAVLAVLCVIGFVQNGEVDFVALACAVASFCAAYAADTARKLLSDLEEIKKQFR